MTSDAVRALRDRVQGEFGAIARPFVEPELATLPGTRAELAARIDHTELRPTATGDDVRRACEVALRTGAAAVCLSPRHIALARDVVGTALPICTVVGFPHGTEAPRVKAYEAAAAVSDGAREIDMVISIGALRAGDLGAVHGEILEVRGAAADSVLKVIIETALLSDEEKVLAALMTEWAGADFVKTSTGFAGGGATVEDVGLLRRAVGGGLQIKASGGIRTAEQAKALLLAGADRLGMSGTEQVLAEFEGVSTP